MRALTPLAAQEVEERTESPVTQAQVSRRDSTCPSKVVIGLPAGYWVLSLPSWHTDHS